MRKLWILWRALDGFSHYGDEMRFVVRAETEPEARELAQEEANQRGGDMIRNDDPRKWRRRYSWLNSDLSYCEELTADGPGEVLCWNTVSTAVGFEATAVNKKP